jgi:multidrug efflux pump subunit AcrA (membrane-fusion protein)
VDADQAELAGAQQTLSEATLTTPIAGTVISVSLVDGQSVSSGGSSSSPEVIVAATTAYEAETTVAVANVGQVKAGEHATVVADGYSSTLDGTVTDVGLESSGTTTSTYPVTITLSGSPKLDAGIDAEISILLGQASNVLTVPTSAVHTIGTRNIVYEMENGKPTLTLVTVGVRGTTEVQITSGLKAGDVVELADWSTPLPSANTNTPFGGAAGLSGGLGGGGAFRFGGGGGAAFKIGGAG